MEVPIGRANNSLLIYKSHCSIVDSLKCLSVFINTLMSLATQCLPEDPRTSAPFEGWKRRDARPPGIRGLFYFSLITLVIDAWQVIGAGRMSTAVKWHDYLSRALFTVGRSRSTSLFVPVLLFPFYPCLDRSIDSRGFLHGEEVGNSCAAGMGKVLKNRSIKVFPALSEVVVVVVVVTRRVPGIRLRISAIHVHAHNVVEPTGPDDTTTTCHRIQEKTLTGPFSTLPGPLAKTVPVLSASPCTYKVVDIISRPPGTPCFSRSRFYFQRARRCNWPRL